MDRDTESRGANRGSQPLRDNPQDMQVDEETGRPVATVPDGEKADQAPEVPAKDRLKIDPDSRIPRPVQPDLA